MCIFLTYLFTGFILFHTSLSAEYEKFNCSVTLDADKRKFVSCISAAENLILLLPDDIPNDIQRLLINAYGSEMTITSKDVFQRYKHLEELEISVRKLNLDDKLLKPETLNELKNELFNLHFLNTLLITYIDKPDPQNSPNISYVLPGTLTKMRLKNLIFEFDVSNCYELEVLNLTNNSMTKLPDFYNPLSTLTLLDLRSNTLNEMKVEELAKLCGLYHISIHEDNMEDCECRKVTQWIEKLRSWDHLTFVGDLNCTKKGTENQCPSYSFDKAVSLRDSCRFAKLWNAVLWILVIFMILVVFCVSAYIYLHRHHPHQPDDHPEE